MSDPKKPNNPPTIGFVGLGAMGFGMATRLVRQGYRVRGYDVFPQSVRRFAAAAASSVEGEDEGDGSGVGVGVGVSTLRESAVDVDHYVCMVATAAQAQVVLFGDHDGGHGNGGDNGDNNNKGIVEALSKGATLLLCSTVPSTYARSAWEQIQKMGRGDIFFIDSPVSGGAARAAAGTLSIMVGASPAALDQGKFILESLSDRDKLFICGGIGTGSDMKMAHQVLAGIHILLASESMGLAARLGLDAREVRETVLGSGSDAWGWMFEHRTPRIIEEDFFPGVSAGTIILKDVGIITSTARRLRFPVPLTSMAEQQYVAGLMRGFGRDDDAGMVRMYHPEPVSRAKKSSSSMKPLDDNDPLSSTEKNPLSGMDLVLTLLRTVYILSCVEAVSFAHFLGLDLDLYFKLVRDAAGGSRMFEKYCEGVRRVLVDGDLAAEDDVGDDGTTVNVNVNVNGLIEGLETVLKGARRAECPLFLGNEALNLLTIARRMGLGGRNPAALAKVWTPGP